MSRSVRHASSCRSKRFPNVPGRFSPLRWNTVSPMWEVLWCMPVYCLVPLFLENTPPILEQWYYFFPPIRGLVVWLIPKLTKPMKYASPVTDWER